MESSSNFIYQVRTSRSADTPAARLDSEYLAKRIQVGGFSGCYPTVTRTFFFSFFQLYDFGSPPLFLRIKDCTLVRGTYFLGGLDPDRKYVWAQCSTK